MTTLLTADFFIRNRAALRHAHKGPLPIVIPANGLLQRTADTALPFTQDSNFWYLTGVDIADAVLVITAEGEYLIIPGRSIIRETFDGHVDHQVIENRSGITTLLYDDEGWPRLHMAVRESGGFSMPLAPPAYLPAYGVHTNPARRRIAVKIKRAVPTAKVHDIRPLLTEMRVRKQPEEILCLETAVTLTKSTLEKLQKGGTFSTMKHEYELEAALTQAFRAAGASGHAYAPIVAAGHNATTLHYSSNASILKRTDLVVVDAGAEVEHYAADITRTICQGQPNPRQQAVYDAVFSTQQSLLSEFRPGAYLKDIERKAEELIGHALVSLKLIPDAEDKKALRLYYPHSSSHFLGLDVHDVGDYNNPLEPNMVLTCEPGIYIPKEHIGVRIEDDVVITESGNRVL